MRIIQYQEDNRTLYIKVKDDSDYKRALKYLVEYTILEGADLQDIEIINEELDKKAA